MHVPYCCALPIRRDGGEATHTRLSATHDTIAYHSTTQPNPPHHTTTRTFREQNSFLSVLKCRVIPHPLSTARRHAFLRRHGQKLHRSAIKRAHECGAVPVNLLAGEELGLLVYALHVALHSLNVFPAHKEGGGKAEECLGWIHQQNIFRVWM